MSINHPTAFKAYCVDCGVEISHQAHSHIYCHVHHSREKILNLRAGPVNFCNICGGRMMPGADSLAHGGCLLNWIRYTQEIQ